MAPCTEFHHFGSFCLKSITCSYFGKGKKEAELRRRNGAKLVAFTVTVPISDWIVLKRHIHIQSKTYNAMLELVAGYHLYSPHNLWRIIH